MNRRTNRPIRSAISPSTPRGGVTLVEVLMSLLVVGVGLVSVAVLFPLSILRTIEATQLTSGTMVRYNAEQMIDAFPTLAIDPEGDGNANEHADTNYIVDPFGYDVLTSLSGNAALANGSCSVLFGGVMDRFPGSVAAGSIISDPANPLRAANFVTLPDSWDTLLDENDSLPNTFDNTVPSIIMPGAAASVGLTADYAAGAGQPTYRVILFDTTGDFSHTRTLTGIEVATDILTWTNPLPAGFIPATVWLQVQERHFSWLLTVRRQTASIVDPGPPIISDEAAEIDVVVFFNRVVENGDPLPAATDQLAESAYPLLEPGFQIGVPTVELDWGTNPEPFLKEGKFIFDPDNARWYRILKITSTGDTSVRLDLDRGADSDSITAGAAGELGLGVFLPGIIDVYPIKSKAGRFLTP